MLVVGGTPPYLWTPDAALPAGLTLSNGGVLSGTPLTTHFNDFYMTVKDADDRSMRRWSRVNVLSGTPVTLRFDSGADLGLIATGQAYNMSLPISFSPAPAASYIFQVVQ